MSPANPRSTLARARRSLLLPLVLAGACLLPASAHASPASDLFDKGTAAFQEGNYEEAEAHYRGAWKLTQSYDVAYSLALTEVHLGKMRDATEHFAYALAHFPITGDADLRTSTEAALADAKKSVFTARIKSNTPDIAITLDGAPVSPATFGEEVYLTVGAHVLEASAPGHRGVKRTLAGTAGGDEDVHLNLVAEPVAGRSLTPVIVLGGLGLVGLVVGGALVGTAEGKKSEAFSLHDEIGTAEGCAAQAEKCKLLRETTAAADGLSNGGVAMLVFGGLAGAGAGLYLLIPSRKPADPGKGDRRDKGAKKERTSSHSAPPGLALSIAPVLGPAVRGVVLSGSF